VLAVVVSHNFSSIGQRIKRPPPKREVADSIPAGALRQTCLKTDQHGLQWVSRERLRQRDGDARQSCPRPAKFSLDPKGAGTPPLPLAPPDAAASHATMKLRSPRGSQPQPICY